MSGMRTVRPAHNEYAPYYRRYIDRVADGDIVHTLRAQQKQTTSLLAALNETQASFRYAPEKWSAREVAGHIIDAERIFAYRALCIARNDTTPLPGFDENSYVANAGFESVPIDAIAAAFDNVRTSTIDVFSFLNEESWMRHGIANDSETSVRALAWIIAGHELHHREILHTRYVL
jgi:uncharacterized damage-inducible protein DinB